MAEEKPQYQYQFNDHANTIIISSKSQKEVEKYYRTFVTKELMPKKNGSAKMRNKELFVTALLLVFMCFGCGPTLEERAAHKKAQQDSANYMLNINVDMSIYSGKVILEKYREGCFCGRTGWVYFFTIPDHGSIKTIQVYQGIYEKYAAGDTIQ